MARARAWGDVIVNDTIGAGQISIDLLANLTPSDNITVARLVGQLKFTNAETVTSGLTSQVISMGIQVVTREAFLAGVFPDPQTADEYPARGWLWRTVVPEYTDASVAAIITWSFPEVKFDMRAMRKVDRGTLALVIQKQSAIGVMHDVRMTGIVRSLCLM